MEKEAREDLDKLVEKFLKKIGKGFFVKKLKNHNDIINFSQAS